LKRSKSKDKIAKTYEEYVRKVSEEYDKKIHKFNNKSLEKQKYIDLKKCEICEGFKERENLVICNLCEDAYHKKCLQKTKLNPNFICKNCDKTLKQKNIDEIYHKTSKESIKVI
jgi:hypothetical protein